MSCFDRIIVKTKKDADDSALANFLFQYIRIISNEKSVEFLPSFIRLNNIQKMLVFLLSRRALSFCFDVQEEINMKQIVKRMATGKEMIMPEGSVKNTISKLLNLGYISSNENGYYIPGYIANLIVEKNLKVKL